MARPQLRVDTEFAPPDAQLLETPGGLPGEGLLDPGKGGSPPLGEGPGHEPRRAPGGLAEFVAGPLEGLLEARRVHLLGREVEGVAAVAGEQQPRPPALLEGPP